MCMHVAVGVELHVVEYGLSAKALVLGTQDRANSEKHMDEIN